jgi:hypothetical protein
MYDICTVGSLNMFLELEEQVQPVRQPAVARPGGQPWLCLLAVYHSSKASATGSPSCPLLAVLAYIVVDNGDVGRYASWPVALSPPPPLSLVNLDLS